MKTQLKIAVLLITTNKIFDAKINMELIRNCWQEYLNNKIDIYHVYNGVYSEYKNTYLEDVLVYEKNPSHYEGAAGMLDRGFRTIFSNGKIYDYIFALSSDVWLCSFPLLIDLLKDMMRRKHKLVTSLWLSYFYLPTLFATEFFIILPQFAKKVFPLKFNSYLKAHTFDRMLYTKANFPPVLTNPITELCFTHHVLSALKYDFFSFAWKRYVALLPHRQVVWGLNRFYSKKLGYYSHHNLKEKISLILQNESNMRTKINKMPTLLGLGRLDAEKTS
jgi:hypothetical protein